MRSKPSIVVVATSELKGTERRQSYASQKKWSECGIFQVDLPDGAKIAMRFDDNLRYCSFIEKESRVYPAVRQEYGGLGKNVQAGERRPIVVNW